MPICDRCKKEMAGPTDLFGEPIAEVVEVPKKPKTLDELLECRPRGVKFLGKVRDGSRTVLDLWRANFPLLEAEGRYRENPNASEGGVVGECEYAFDHKARKKAANVVRYLQGWLLAEEKKLRYEWSRRPENRQRFEEAPGANRSRDVRGGGLAPAGDYGRGPGDLNVAGRSGGVRATDAIVERIRAAKPTAPEDDEAAAAALAAMKGAR